MRAGHGTGCLEWSRGRWTWKPEGQGRKRGLRRGLAGGGDEARGLAGLCVRVARRLEKLCPGAGSPRTSHQEPAGAAAAPSPQSGEGEQ